MDEELEDVIPTKDSDDEEESDKEGEVVGELITNIFGSSDEEEEFEGFGEADMATHTKKDKAIDDDDDDNENNEKEGSYTEEGNRNDSEKINKSPNVLPNLSSEDEGPDDKNQNKDDFVSDFDLMMEKRRMEMKKKRRKRKDVDVINDSDDLIEDMLKSMKEAAEADRQLNKQKKPAIKIMLHLPYVKQQLKKVDLHQAFLDSGILGAITEWLAPLPDHSLPHLEVRETLLKQLMEFPQISTEGLKMSGLGKAIMYLFKHPKETKANKDIAHKLITEWARPLFSQNADYKSLSREEREQRDYEQLPKKKKLSSDADANRDLEKSLESEDGQLRPGDPGFISRARVPAPSNKDYVIRPKWTVEDKPRTSSSKKVVNKFQQYQRQFMDKKRASKLQSAAAISIEGRNMPL